MKPIGCGDESGTCARRRGQATLLGVVLLIGMVGVISAGIFIVAGEAVTSAEQQAEDERIEQAFVELGKTMATASADADGVRTIDFEAGESGAIAKTDAGWVKIEGGDVVINRSIGAVEYVGDDGSVVAYQSGGVWSERGNQTRMLSAPNVNYDSDSETLWFPITTMSGEESLESGEIVVKQNRTDPMGNARFVENDSVTMTIQSEYYRGWEKFFRNEAGGSVQGVDHTNRTVTVLFGYAEFDEAFDTGASIGSDDEEHFHDQHDKFDGVHETGRPMPEMDSVIDAMIDDAKAGDADQTLTGDTYDLDNGTYFVDEINGDIEYEFNLTEGNVTLIVEGDVKLGENGYIRVSDRDASKKNVLRIYSGGDEAVLDGEVCTTADCKSDASAIQYYGKSNQAVDFGPGNSGAFEGLLYVASAEEKDWWDGSTGNCKDHHQVHMQGGGEFYGSIVAYSACAHSNSVEFDYDPDLADEELDAYPDGYELPPQITYLNVAVHELDVENR